MHQVVAVDVEGVGKLLDADVVGEMFIQIIQYGKDLLVGRGGWYILDSIPESRAVELYHKFQEENVVIQLICIFGALEGLQELADDLPEMAALKCRNTQNMRMVVMCPLQTQREIDIILPVLIQKILGYVDDDALVGRVVQ